jgi:hypothetical protein
MIGKGFGSKRLWPSRGDIPEFAWRGRVESRKPQVGPCPSQDSNRAPPEYESRVLPLRQT